MKIALFLIALLLTPIALSAQIPTATQVAILKAEDSRDYDAIKPFISGMNFVAQERAVLAAGRIGDERAVLDLIPLLRTTTVAYMAAFALGEIESITAADAILHELRHPSKMRGGDASGNLEKDTFDALVIEAAGKIAAANPSNPKSKELASEILRFMDLSSPGRHTSLSGLTALLRSRPEGTDRIAAKFLIHSNPLIRASAANTLARIRAKNSNVKARELLVADIDPNVRANAARLLGAAEDKESLDLLLNAAINDSDSRVRVSAIRSLATLKDAKSADPLLKRGEDLLASYSKSKKPNFIPAEQNEFIEIATAIGRIMANTNNSRADKLFADFGKLDKGHTPEVYIARVRVGPKRGDGSSPELVSWRQYSTMAQIIGEFAAIEPTSEVGKEMKTEAPGIIRPLAKAFAEADPATEGERTMAGPDVLQAFARFKTEDLSEIARLALQNQDVQMRAAAAGILGDLPVSNENVAALKTAFTKALLTDKMENDAQLAILDAAFKLDKKEAVGILLVALNATDYLVRQRAFTMLENDELENDFPGIETSLKNARAKNKDKVLPYAPAFGTKLGQVLNTDVDYRRAVARKNGSVKAVFTTEKGTFTIDLLPEDAPLTVDNFVKLANAKYFNGLEVHRVVPNFVMQDGDPRGDGNGGPGWSIRCELNMVSFDRGAVGMALSGKDTGGSQWFVTHASQPHLDGGYTVFGHVNETDMKVVDNIVRGDRILMVRIIEGNSTQRPARFRSK